MLVQALLAGLVVGLSKMEYFFGYSMFNRPIVEGAIMGLVLGDPVTGTIIGATLEIVFLGSFPVGAAVSPDGGTAAGVIFGKFMCILDHGKTNPLIGSAGVSAVPMAARVSQVVGQKANPSNFLLMHAMGPNVAGVIGTAVAAGTMLAMIGAAK